VHAAAARIKRIAIRQERQSALFLAEISHNFGILRTQESHVPQFTEMHLDSNELAIHIDVLNASCQAQCLELLQQARSHLHTEVGKINF
jgi:hypothetical protein